MRTRLVLLVAALAAAAGLALVAYDGRIAPGVRIAGVEVGGSTAQDAASRVVARTGEASVNLVADGISIRLDASYGLGFDVEGAVAEARAVGRDGDLLRRARDVIEALTGGRDVALRRHIADAERFGRTMDLVAATVERPPVDGDVGFGPSGATRREPHDGIVLDRVALVAALLARQELAPSVALPLATRTPVLDDEAIATAYEAVRNAELPLVLVVGDERVVLEPARLAPFVAVGRRPAADGDTLVASVAQDALPTLVDEIADALDSDVREAALVPGEERLIVIPGQEGITVDRVAARELVGAAILAPERVVVLPAEVEHPRLTTEEALRAADEVVLLGGFTTYFPVNAARATNIGIAARTFDGMTVAPGASFSFWGRLGEVSPRTGYVTAGTIIGGVSSYAIGGGLCQVSTTFFNAVARAGFQVDERHPHSYYIERYPLGLDASVLAPWADMRWTNDTGLTAIVRASATDTSVSFWIYGAPTGRRVEISATQEWDLVWPSPDQPADPQHVPGYVVLGRDTLVVRTVYEGTTIVHLDRWYSHYDPVWGGPAR